MQIENISAIPPEIDTVEKLYLWCYYQLSTTNERVEIEGEKEYLVDSELIRPDGVDPRLFLITKINLPIDENWLINGFKLWENAIEILEGAIEKQGDPFSADVLLWLKGDDISDSSPLNQVPISGTPYLDTQIKKYGISSFSFPTNSNVLNYADNAGMTQVGGYTIEAWCYFSVTPTSGFWTINASTNSFVYTIRFYPSYIYILGVATYSVTFPLNTWVHIAIVYPTNTSYRLYINGVMVEEGTHNRSYNNTPSFGFGFTRVSNIIFRFNGNIDSFRITNSVRYTADFDPETDTYLAY